MLVYRLVHTDLTGIHGLWTGSTDYRYGYDGAEKSDLIAELSRLHCVSSGTGVHAFKQGFYHVNKPLFDEILKMYPELKLIILGLWQSMVVWEDYDQVVINIVAYNELTGERGVFA